MLARTLGDTLANNLFHLIGGQSGPVNYRRRVFSLSICYVIWACAHATRRDVTRWTGTTATSTVTKVASAIYRNRNLPFRFRPTALAITVAATAVVVTAPRQRRSTSRTSM